MQTKPRMFAIALVLTAGASLCATPAHAKIMPRGKVIEPSGGSYGMVREVGFSAMAGVGLGASLGIGKHVKDGKTTRYLVTSLRGMFGTGVGASAHVARTVYTGGTFGDVLIPRKEFALNWGLAFGVGRERVGSSSHSLVERIPEQVIEGNSERFLLGASLKAVFETSRNFRLRLTSSGGV